jgi:cytochrome c peroxidase
LGVATLEQQAALPITNSFEMGSASIGDAVSGIANDKEYQTQFMQAFGRSANAQDGLSAIAAYERTLASFDCPFDHFIAGEANFISDSAKRGWELFDTKARCHLCHALTEDQRDAILSSIAIFTTLVSGSPRSQPSRPAVLATGPCR